MAKLDYRNSTTIHGWMITDLDLKGNELIIFSIIHGFSQNCDDQYFYGSLSYLSEWTHLSRPSVINILNSLTEKGYIEKFEEYRNGVKFCKYKSKNFTSSKETLLPVKKPNGGSKKTLPNIKDNIKDITKERKSNGYDAILQTVDERIRDTVIEFIKMRKFIKAPMTDNALLLMLKKLNQMSQDPDTQREILEQSIANSWKGIFPLKEEAKPKYQAVKPNWDINRQDAEDDIYTAIQRMAEREYEA